MFRSASSSESTHKARGVVGVCQRPHPLLQSTRSPAHTSAYPDQKRLTQHTHATNFRLHELQMTLLMTRMSAQIPQLTVLAPQILVHTHAACPQLHICPHTHTICMCPPKTHKGGVRSCDTKIVPNLLLRRAIERAPSVHNN